MASLLISCLLELMPAVGIIQVNYGLGWIYMIEHRLA